MNLYSALWEKKELSQILMDERIEICALCKMGLLLTVVLDILLSCLKNFQNSKLVEAAIDRQYFVRIIYN